MWFQPCDTSSRLRRTTAQWALSHKLGPPDLLQSGGHWNTYIMHKGDSCCRVQQKKFDGKRRYQLYRFISQVFGTHSAPLLPTDPRVVFARCCLWQAPDDPLPCYVPIGLDDVPRHFKAHGIKGMKRKAIIQCYWDGCGHNVTRHNFVRHIRDIHLRLFVFLCRAPCQTLITLSFTFSRV